MAPKTFAKVATSLGDEMLMLAGLTGHEALGKPFEYELDLFSLDAKISLKDIVAQPVTVQIELREGKYRFINGIATKFACVGGAGRYTLYRCTLRPWFWLLTRQNDCRIFQNESVPDVIMKVFRDAGFSDFDKNFGRSYRTWEYICQYRESSFNFVSRLMEQEGIYYYFKHEDGKHTLYMTDHYSGHEAQAGYEEIPYYPPYAGEQRDRDHIDGWRVSQEIQPGRFALNDFNFKKPKAGMRAVVTASENMSELEVYDYPGEYDELADGEDSNRLRMEQATAQYEIVEGQGNARGLVCGTHFTLTGMSREDQNREYLVTNASFSLDTGEFESTHRTGPKVTYRVSFRALESNTPFRPARETPKPEIAGPQTAIVTGGAGDEIYTDQWGRVKVKFHWDRTPEKNETSSCWVRVSQVWAGGDWGAMHIPRVGQEVIVEFLEGDPDRPIITGRVYNANSMPPYKLPANKTQSGIKSRSTKGGLQNNFNELRFEDKKGEEQLYVQAEKNMDTLVKNDQSLTVNANRTKVVGGNETTQVHKNRKETVTLNETIEIQGNRDESVLGSETLNITGPRSETVLNTETIAITGARTEVVGGPETITINSGRTTTIAAADVLIVGAGYTLEVTGAGAVSSSGAYGLDVGGDHTVSVSGNDSLSADGSQTVAIGGARSQTVDKTDRLTVKDSLVLESKSDVTIKAGSASITLKKNGDITIKGNNINLKGSGKIAATASGDVKIKGSKVASN